MHKTPAARKPAITRTKPKDRAAWLALRRQDVTASAISALFGANPYMTVADLWAEKTGLVKRQTEETPAMRRGRLMEAPAVQILREERPDWKIRHVGADNIYYREAASRIGGTPDVIAEVPGRGKIIVQIKSVDRGVFRRDWHSEDGAVEIPLQHALQATLEAHLAGAAGAAVGAQLFGFGGLDLELIEVPLIPGVIDAMRVKAAEFWALVDSGKEPPIDFARDGDLIAAMYPAQADDVTVDLSQDNRVGELLELREKYKRQADSAKADLETIANEIKAKMGNATLATLADGRNIKWRLESRKGYSVEATEFRVLRYPSGPRRITATTPTTGE